MDARLYTTEGPKIVEESRRCSGPVRQCSSWSVKEWELGGFYASARGICKQRR